MHNKKIFIFRKIDKNAKKEKKDEKKEISSTLPCGKVDLTY